MDKRSSKVIDEIFVNNNLERYEYIKMFKEIS